MKTKSRTTATTVAEKIRPGWIKGSLSPMSTNSTTGKASSHEATVINPAMTLEGSYHWSKTGLLL
ncbi:MAG: hypothetical protein ACE5MG_11455, partial [Candidatus Methylomirabilales bacterium]